MLNKLSWNGLGDKGDNMEYECPKGMRFGYDTADRLCYYPFVCPLIAECIKENLRLFGKEPKVEKIIICSICGNSIILPSATSRVFIENICCGQCNKKSFKEVL